MGLAPFFCSYLTGTLPPQPGLEKFQRRATSSGLSPHSALSQLEELHATT
ncbi:MAG: hypothetical protein JO069_12750 [Verrucomicrobia bacterium]|nr:hypothetical protein [Verrucomicrobiota bacterium]